MRRTSWSWAQSDFSEACQTAGQLPTLSTFVSSAGKRKRTEDKEPPTCKPADALNKDIANPKIPVPPINGQAGRLPYYYKITTHSRRRGGAPGCYLTQQREQVAEERYQLILIRTIRSADPIALRSANCFFVLTCWVRHGIASQKSKRNCKWYSPCSVKDYGSHSHLLQWQPRSLTVAGKQSCLQTQCFDSHPQTSLHSIQRLVHTIRNTSVGF